MGMQIDIPSYQTLYREATLEGEPEIEKEEVRRSVRRLGRVNQRCSRCAKV